MPSFHISSSGKLVKCKNDPCKLHAGADFHAENIKEAQKLAEHAIMSNNTTKSARNVELSENTQRLAQNYYNNILNYAEGCNLENKMEATYGYRSREFQSARLANIKKSNSFSDAREALCCLLPTYDWPIDDSKKAPKSFIRAVGRFEIAAKAEDANSTDETRLAREAAWNKVEKEVNKIYRDLTKN